MALKNTILATYIIHPNPIRASENSFNNTFLSENIKKNLFLPDITNLCCKYQISGKKKPRNIKIAVKTWGIFENSKAKKQTIDLQKLDISETPLHKPMTPKKPKNYENYDFIVRASYSGVCIPQGFFPAFLGKQW